VVFRNPIMLVGLAAALVPLVLHFLNRARYRNVEWGAMMFLDGMEPRAYQGAQLKQWILLGVRTTILGLLAVALARPVFSVAGAPPADQGRTAAVILLDTSASTSLNDNGRIRLDLAREAAFGVLSPGLKRGDDLWVIPMGDHDPQATAIYATDPQDMARRVKELTTPSGRADVAAALREAARLLTQSQAPNKEIYVICDRQAGSWRGVDEPSFAGEWADLLRESRIKPRLLIVPVGTEEFDNVSVEAIEPVGEPFVVGQPGEVEVRLHNYGAVPRTAVPFEVGRVVGARRVPLKQSTVSLPAGAITRVTAPIVFPDAGSSVIYAHVTAPGLPTDKELDLSVEVLRDVRALIIDGDEREAAMQNASDFLRAALAPYKNNRRDTAIVSLARPDNWTPADLADVRVVIAANVGSFSEAQARALEQFVWDGGGLIVAPGDQVRPENYTSQLAWLPAALQSPTAESEAGATLLGPLDLAHPVFRFMKGRADAAPPSPVRRYFPVTPKAGADVIARYADANPFIVSGDVGKGRVLIVTTPVDPDWNGLPLTNFFLPLAQSLVRYAAAAPSAEATTARNVTTNRPIVAEFHEPLDPKTVTLGVPVGKPDSSRLSLAPADSGWRVTYFGTYAPGIYRISPAAQANARAQQFVVSTPRAESDLTPMTDEQWSHVAKVIGAERVETERRPIPLAQEALREGVDLWLPLIGAAVILSMLELSAARRWAGEDQ
jgi:hypothetical protein